MNNRYPLIKSGALTFLSLLLFFGGTNAQTLQLEPHWWQPNGKVESIARVGNTVYLAGNFSFVGPDIPYGTTLSVSTGAADLFSAKPNGAVNCVVPDGAGGWYIGGQFDHVGGQPRNQLARINADGTLHPWIGNVWGGAGVNALAINANTLYVGGDFTTASNTSRNCLAAFTTTTGALTGWNPNVDRNFPYSVTTLAVSGSTVYAGGTFTKVGGLIRNRIAALDAVTGIPTGWNPNLNSAVYDIEADGNVIYVGGLFTSIGSQARNYIGAINAATGLATSWNPGADQAVNELSLTATKVYAGGTFTSMGGAPRSNLAAVDKLNGQATAWNPGANSSVTALVATDSLVYAGGYFTTISGQPRNRLAALDAVTGTATSWNPDMNNAVYSLALQGASLYAGGAFISANGGRSCGRIAALDATTGKLTSWSPGGANLVVHSITATSSTVYIGGNFTKIGTTPRSHMAALDAVTGAVTAWNPGPDGIVNTVVIDGQKVYAGGNFSFIGGQNRSMIAALDISTGLATAWNPNPVHQTYWAVKTILVNGNSVFVGGNFTTFGGQPRTCLAELDATTGQATAWNPNLDGNTSTRSVFALAASSTTLYVGGTFTSIGGELRNNLASFNLFSKQINSWNPNAGSHVYALAVSGSTVYVGGAFLKIANQLRYRLASVDATTGKASTWNPSPNDPVTALNVTGSRVFAVGYFSNLVGIPPRYFAVFSPPQAAPDILTGTLPASAFCTGNSFSVPFLTTGAFQPGNLFRAQLSNAQGAFTNPTVIGTLTAASSDTITVTIPVSITSATAYRIRVVASVPGSTGSDNGSDFSIGSIAAAPGQISGPAANVCGGSTATYTIGAVTGAAGYNWIAPAGASITSGQGSTSVSISFGAAFAGGKLRVTADNSCGSSTERSLSIRSVLDLPGLISGTVNGVCASTSSTYSTAAVSGASGYTWTAPAGASISSGQGGTSVTVSFSASFVSGNLSVQANNTCGSSSPRTLSIRSVPAAPAAISGPVAVCTDSTASYAIAPVAGATTYFWTVGNGAVITSGQGTTSIKVDFGPATGPVGMSVKASNGCGLSTGRSYTVNLASCQRLMSQHTQQRTEMEVYPNPSNGQFQINYSAGENSTFQLQLFDVTGRLVKQQTMQAREGNNSASIMATDLPKGIYLLELSSENGVQRQRIAIE